MRLPQNARAHGDGIEWLERGRLFLSTPRLGEHVPVWTQAEDLHGAVSRIDQPHVRDAFASVDPHLLDAIDARRARRQDLGGPVGRGRVERVVVDDVSGVALLAPATQVGHDDVGVGAHMDLGLVEDDPSTRTMSPGVERAEQEAAERRGCAEVAPPRAWMEVELAVDHLSEHRLGGVEHVLVGGAFASRVGHRGET